MSENITPAEHLAEVQATFSGDPRTVEIMRSAVKHLHAFVEEVGLTRDEWFAGIKFLTEVGHKCDDVRQEFILLSDTLGVSMLVEMVNQEATDGTTGSRSVFFRETGFVHVETHDRATLGPGDRVAGPAIIDQPDSTTVVPPGSVVDVDGGGNLVIAVREAVASGVAAAAAQASDTDD